MKKILLVAIIILSAALRLSAEKTAEVTLRYSRTETSARIVLEAADEVIKNSTVSVSPTSIKIDFPSVFEIRKPSDFFYETAKRDRSFFIFLKDAVDVKTSRLYGPTRLVFDIKLPAKAEKNAPAKPEQKVSQATGPLVSPGPPQNELPPQAPGAQKQQPAPSPTKPTEKTQDKAHKKRVIVIDAGHGGYDYGIVSQDAREKDVNLTISKDLSAAMAKKGFTVFLDRKVDQSVPIGERINFSNGKNPDFFISIHAASWNGFAVYVSASEDTNFDSAIKLYGLSSRQSVHLARSKEVARIISANLKQDFNVDVVLRELPLPMLNSLNAPAVLIEYPSMKLYSSDQKMRDRFVAAILKGVAVHE